MAKKAYIGGTDNKAHKVKKIYGGIDDIARKIRKAYIGVGGVARPCFSTGLEYYGSSADGAIEALSSAISVDASAIAGNYAIFYGGDTSSNTYTSATNIYDELLSKVSTNIKSHISKYGVTGVSFKEYALFGGGRGYTDYVKVINKDLTNVGKDLRLNSPVANAGGCATNNYAMFAGGIRDTATYSEVATAFDENLSTSYPPNLSNTRTRLAGASIDDYALFAGGVVWDYVNGRARSSNLVEIYQQLTKFSNTTLTNVTQEIVGITFSSRAVFSYSNIIDCFDMNLTKTSYMRDFGSSYKNVIVAIGKYLICAGGTQNVAEIFDEEFTKIDELKFEPSRDEAKAEVLGKFAIVAGGIVDHTNTYTVTDVVNVYTY